MLSSCTAALTFIDMNVIWVKLICMPILLGGNFFAGILPFYLFHCSRHLSFFKCSSWSKCLFWKMRTDTDREPLSKQQEVVLEATSNGGSNDMIEQELAVTSPSKVPPAVSVFSSSLFSLANCLSGGIFLATTFIILLPNSREKYSHQLSHEHSHENFTHSIQNQNLYPLPEVSLCLGFFLVWFSDLIVQEWLQHRAIQSQKRHLHLVAASNSNPAGPTSEEHQLASVSHSGETASNPQMQPEPMVTSEESPRHFLKAILLTLALSTHTFLEAVAFGLLDRSSQVVNMALAMLLHQLLCAFSLGMRLTVAFTANVPFSSSLKCRWPSVTFLAFLLGYCCLIPLGVCAGLFLHRVATGSETANQNSSARLAAVLLQGGAAGTLLYMVFVDMLPAEILASHSEGSRPHCHQLEDISATTRADSASQFPTTRQFSPTWKAIICFLGFVIMSLLRLAHNSEH